MLLIAPDGSSRLQILFDGALDLALDGLLIALSSFHFAPDRSFMLLIAPYGSSRFQVLCDGTLDLAFFG